MVGKYHFASLAITENMGYGTFVNRIPNLAAKTAATEHFLERKIFWTRPTRWCSSTANREEDRINQADKGGGKYPRASPKRSKQPHP